MTESRKTLKCLIDYLEAEIKRIQRLYEKTLRYQNIDPEVSLFQARKSAEAICKSIYIKEGLHKEFGKPVSKLMLKELIQKLERKNVLPEYIKINLHTILAFGNFGSHDQGEENGIITAEYIKPCLLGLGTVFNWYVKEYCANQDEDLLVNQTVNIAIIDSCDNESRPDKTLAPESGTIKIVGNHAPPYRIYRETEVAGIYYDIIKIIAERLDFKIGFINKPRKSALVMMKSGEADLMVGPNKTEEKENFMIFSTATLPSERKGFFVHISGKPVLSYEDLYNRLLVVARGVVYTDKIDTDPNLKKITVTDYKQGFRMLNENADYVMIMPEKEGEYLIDAYEYDVLTSPFYMEGRPSHLALSKKSKHKKLFSLIDASLKDLKKEGIYEEIMHFY